jgi:hypothetical protein
MKRLLFAILFIVSVVLIGRTAGTGSVITFSINVQGTAYSNAASYNILYGTSPYVYTGSTNIGTNTSITVSNFPHGIQYYFTFQCYDSNGVFIGNTPPDTYGYLVPTPSPVPTVTHTIIVP